MDQSLRTVATQLLNSTKHEDFIKMSNEKIVSIETPMEVVQVSTKAQDVNHDDKKKDSNLMKMKFGIPTNSKFGPFEITNPGHAMPMTDEEIEKEMATVTTTEKKQPTTPSLLSTWIQLYPLSSTTEGNNIPKSTVNVQSNQIMSTTSVKLPSSVIKPTTSNTKPVRKTEPKYTTVPTLKTTELPFVTKVVKNASTSSTSNFVKISTTTLTTSIDNDVEETETVNENGEISTPFLMTTKLPSKKSPNKNNTTLKPKLATPKNSTNKSPKPSASPNRNKTFTTRRPGSNNDTVTSTSKIEKVTLKPQLLISQNRTETSDRPMFVTKIKATLLTDNQKFTTLASTTTKSVHTLLSKSNFSHLESMNTKIPNPTRVNNVLKVNSKKHIDDTTKIEIQPFRVIPPVLTIEKNEEDSSDQKINNILKNSKNDININFDTDVSKVEIQTQPPVDLSSSTIITSTSKKPRSSNKRKKNKNRRRKTSTTSSTTSATTIMSSDDENQTTSYPLSIDELQVTGIQESKIEPESKVSPSKKKKPNQQTQVQKPISSQIYNFISREVMPSVGVMSLVGLGLGLASYFLYPFGGVITRRNYETEPNYKYNIDEYGGNYGLSEEEVLSKVYSGMTGSQRHVTKYRPGEKNPNYYRYSALEQSQNQPTTRYPESTIKSGGNRVIYRPVETTAYGANFRNTEFQYPDVSTTSNYYEQQRQHHAGDFSLLGVEKDRQFVVGNIPKEYSGEEVDKISDVLTSQSSVEKKYLNQVNNIYTDSNSPTSSMLTSTLVEGARSPSAFVTKADEEKSPGVFKDIKISSSGSLVEHGPRSLKFDEFEKKSTVLRSIRQKRGILPDLAGSFIPMIKEFKSPRKERNSVIQVIPPKSEIEKEKREEAQEEDLSNEILDIIDDALPGKQHKTKHGEKDHTVASSKQHSKESITTTAAKTTIASSASTNSATKINEKLAASTTTTTGTTSTTTTTTSSTPTEPDFVDQGETTLDWRENVSTTSKPQTASGGVDILGIAKRIAEVKLRLGLTILKHASEGFAKYISHIQKRFNGEE